MLLTWPFALCGAMELYEKIYGLLCSIIRLNSWPELNGILNRAVSGKPREWALPVTACRAVGGDEEQAVPAAAAIACLQISILLIDDMLDQDPRGDYHCVGPGAAANMASAFQAIGLEAVSQTPSLSVSQKQSILQRLNRMMFTTAFGQYKDSLNAVDEAEYWLLVETKSAPFFSTAFHIGALAALESENDRAADQICQFGKLYGEIIQIHDDLNDSMAQPANPDWIHGRSPLPILFAKSVTHPHQARFRALCNAITDPEALVEAQNILISCGAVSYCIKELVDRCQKAQKLLNSASLAYKVELQGLLDALLRPVQQMLEKTEEMQRPARRSPSTDFL